MDALLQSGIQFLQALVVLVWNLGAVILPWSALIAWLAFWAFAVNWVKLREVLSRGGWIGLVLIGAVMVLVWGSIAPPQYGGHPLYSLTLSNFVMKTVLVTSLICLMLLAGAVQLSSGWTPAEPVLPADDHGDHGHGDGHDDHGHGGTPVLAAVPATGHGGGHH